MAFRSFLRRIGAPTERYLRRARLPVLSRSPDTHVLVTRAWSFFDIAANENDPSLGWLVGEDIAEHNLNARLLHKLGTAPSLLQALRRFLRLANEEATHLQLGMYERQADVLIYTHYQGKSDVPGYHVAQAYQVGVILGLIRHFLGRHWIPGEIGIEQQTAPAAMVKLYPGCRVMTRQPVGYIAVPQACLHFASPDGAGETGVLYEPAPGREDEFLDTLCTALKARLPDGYPPARSAAALMGVSERTLARRLSVYGRTYGELIDEIRFVEARKLLQEPRTLINDVAALVGFADQANFARMFRRMGGISPTDFRKMILS
jgi:AraC-like DNA-binding protein